MFFCFVLHLPTCVKYCLIHDKESSKSLSSLTQLLPGGLIALFFTLNPEVTVFLAANFIVNPGQSDQCCCSTFLYSHKEMAEVHKPIKKPTLLDQSQVVTGQFSVFFSIFLIILMCCLI